MHNPCVLDGHHISRLHLQTDVILFRVHEIVKGPHGPVELLHLQEVGLQLAHLVDRSVEVGVAGKVRPVQPHQLAASVVSADQFFEGLIVCTFNSPTTTSSPHLNSHKEWLLRNWVELDVVGAHVPEAGHRVGEQLIPGMLNGYKLSQKKGAFTFWDASCEGFVQRGKRRPT